MARKKYSHIRPFSVNHYPQVYEAGPTDPSPDNDRPGIGGTTFKIKLAKDWFLKVIENPVLIIKPFSES